MENEPVLMGCIGDERDRFSMHVHVCMCVTVTVNGLQVRVCVWIHGFMFLLVFFLRFNQSSNHTPSYSLHEKRMVLHILGLAIV